MPIGELGGSSLIVVIRWIAFVPVSVVSNVLFDSVFMHIARWNIGRIWFVSDPESFVPLFSSGAGALAGVLMGAAVAPRFRGIVALALVILQMTVASLVVGLVISGVLPGQPPLPLGLNFLGSLMGSAMGFWIVFRRFGWRGSGPIFPSPPRTTREGHE